MGGDLKGALAEVVALEMNRPGWCELITILGMDKIGLPVAQQPCSLFIGWNVENHNKSRNKVAGQSITSSVAKP